MLPNLSSNNWGASLQIMKPIATGPANALKRETALLELMKVQEIRVSSIGKARYAVEVMTQREELIANCQELASSIGIEYATQDDHQPQRTVVRIERDLFEFKTLRDKLYDTVYEAHRGERCDFCNDILDWSVLGMNPDGLFIPLLGRERIARKLTKYLTNLLEMTNQQSSDDSQSCCAGKTLVPQFVHEFLLVAKPPATA